MKINKIAFAVVAALCLFTIFSCTLLTEPILPKSWLKFAPEAADDLKDVDTSTLADKAGDISIIADPEASRAVLTALGSKSEDEIKALKPEQKESVLALTTSAILPVDTIMGTAYDILFPSNSNNNTNAYARSGNENNAASEDDSDSDLEELQELVKSVLGKISFVDTNAAEVILKEIKDLNQVPGNEKLPNIMLSTISIVVSSCTSGYTTGEVLANLENNVGMQRIVQAAEAIVTYFEEDTHSQTAQTVANSIITNLGNDNSNLTEEEVAKINAQIARGKDALKIALEVIDWLKTKDINLDNLVDMLAGGMNK